MGYLTIKFLKIPQPGNVEANSELALGIIILVEIAIALR